MSAIDKEADSRGFPVDKNGIYTVNTPIKLRFSIATVSTDVDGNVLPYSTMTQASSVAAPTAFQPTACTPDSATTATAITPGQGTLRRGPAALGQLHLHLSQSRLRSS